MPDRADASAAARQAIYSKYLVLTDRDADVVEVTIDAIVKMLHSRLSPGLAEQLGRATWTWDQDMGMHLPVCSGYKHDVRRSGLYQCGNGPLTGENIDTGLCDEGPHLEPHERSI